VVNGAGFVPVGWTVDTLGWKGTSGGITTQTVVSRVLGGLRPGEIVLMHCGSNPDDHSSLDAAALPAMIQNLRAPGNCLLSRSSRTLNPAPDVLTSYA
jgi:peptidoglycan/xylan/chitin deacetylase (PgdA/CDA1 family)